MPRKAKGSCYESGGRFYAAVTLSDTRRPHVPLPACKDRPEAEARTLVINELAQKLRASGHATSMPDLTMRFLRSAGEDDAKKLARTVSVVEAVCRGEATPKRSALMDLTVQQLGERYTSNEIATEYPDHVRPMKTWKDVGGMLALHVYPVAGPVLLRDFTIETGDTVMRSLAPDLEKSTRHKIAGYVNRLLNLAVHPLRILSHNPLPRGWVPKLPKDGKAKSCLYPDEDARLLGSQTVALENRILWGYLHREGNRYSEAVGYTWSDFDLARGVTNLDENKTNAPRFWTLQADVVRSLRAVRRCREIKLGRPIADNEPIFVDDDGVSRLHVSGAAKRYREDLKAAGVERPQLFTHNDHRRRVRAHDTRAAFTTIALANGHNETWIMDRTGHTTSRQMHGYRRAARSYAELHLGPWRPMDQLIPELAPFLEPPAGVQASPGASSEGPPRGEVLVRASGSTAPKLPPATPPASTASDLSSSPRGDGSANDTLPGGSKTVLAPPKKARQRRPARIVEDSVATNLSARRRIASSDKRSARDLPPFEVLKCCPTIRPESSTGRTKCGRDRRPRSGRGVWGKAPSKPGSSACAKRTAQRRQKSCRTFDERN